MIGEVITVGDELIRGRTMDMNSWYAAGMLTNAGLKLRKISCVGDDPRTMEECFRGAIEGSGFLIITGGLGSTQDDITSEVLAQALGLPLEINQLMLNKVKALADTRHVELSPNILKMAYLPQGANIFSLKGSACGFWLVYKEVPIYVLPGVPGQMRYLLEKYVIPDLLARYPLKSHVAFKRIKTYGITEPEIAQRIERLGLKGQGIILGFYPQFPENHVTITVEGDQEGGVEGILKEAEEQITKELGHFVFGKDSETMEEVIGKGLREKGLTLSCAESCTGGLVAHRVTNVPGSSDYFLGGVVAYSNSMKVNLLQVNEVTLRDHGAVSKETVLEMARGIRALTGSDISVAISGIAGPGGGTEEKPVGTVFISMCAPGLEEFSQGYRFYGNRQEIKQDSATMALDWIRRYLNGHPFLSGL